MVDAYGKVGFKPTGKAGHADGQEDEKTARKIFGAPALGYADRIYVKGDKLMADFTKVPRRFADLIKAGAYSRVSSEIYWNYKDDNSGTTYPRVLKSVAFLGADVPALTNLREIEALYSKGENGQLVAYDENKNEFRAYEKDYCGCGGEVHPAGNGMADYLVRLARKTKADAGYAKAAENDQETCLNCKFYVLGLNACSLVEGYIEPGYTSDYFEPREGLDLEPKAPVYSKLHESKSYNVQKRDGKWCLISKSGGETLGCHDTEEAAWAQERAIKANEHAKASGSKTYTKREDYGMDVKEMNGEFCIFDGEEKVRCYPTEAEASEQAKLMSADRKAKGAYEAKEQELKAAHDKEVADLKAKYDKQLADAKEQVRTELRADFEKQQQASNERIAKLEQDRKQARVDQWVSDQKREGKLLPVHESRIKALLYQLPEEGAKVVCYSHDGKDIKSDVAETIKSVIESMPSVFKGYSKATEEPDLGDEADNPRDEVDRRAKVFQQKNSGKTYTEAVKAVLNEDKELAQRYHGAQN